MKLEPESLEQIRAVVEERLGVNLSRGGLSDVLSRFVAQTSMEATVLLGDALDGEVFQGLVDAVTVQHSWLFRDQQQLESACALLHLEWTRARREVSVWVPACATGEDVYSVAALCGLMGIPAHVLGTDVHAGAIETARRGRYGDASVRGVPPEHRSAVVKSGADWEIASELRRSVSLQLHNLLDPPPPSPTVGRKWDLIVCRNVLIYLSREHVWRVLEHLRSALAPSGTLVLGAGDIVTELPPGLVPQAVRGRVVFKLGEERAAAELGPVAILPRVVPPPPAPTRVAPTPAAPRSASPKPVVPTLEGEVEQWPSRGEAGGWVEASPDDRTAPHEDLPLAVGHLEEGIAFHLAGELHQAAQELRKALFLVPALWPASYYLALTLEGLGRYEEARRCYGEVLRGIDESPPLPPIDGHDFTFLRRDVAEVARQRARRHR